MPTMLVRAAVLILLAALTACASSTTSPGASDDPGDGASSSEAPASTPPAASPTASEVAAGPDLSGGDPTADVWIFNGAGIIRVDATSGEEVGQRVFDDLGCRWEALAGVGPTTAWILGTGIASIPEGGFFPPPPSDNPLTGGCVGRVPLDGGEVEVDTFEIPDGERPHFWDGTIVGDDAWFAAAHVANEGGGSIGPGNSDLYRASADGVIEMVASGITDIAVAGDAYYVINDPDGDGFDAAALLDPESGDVTPMTIQGLAGASVDAVEANGELVVFSITTFEPFERGLVATDTAGSVLGSVFQGAVDGSLFPYREFWATDDAIIALAEGVLMAPMQPNATPEVLDLCSPLGTPDDPPECRYGGLYGVSNGAWVVHVVQTATPQVQTLRHYDAASRAKGAEVELPTLDVR